ncbi:MAG: hypothetical protein HN919_13005 [Verrucomicrobia bacterium]|jgi:DNA repair exonuclease SbcCD nuclease subunit|nr:hypothetical protein [Verrucomicrobiota bacterium]MBT7067219.1 hypothetical protein [Verrucomicrobiota bacterium]MBT7702363.1 hypothetical protein [Verrucomicrobiota bacterium]
MTRFLYLSDTHYGAESAGYCQQTAYPQRQTELVQGLTAWMAEHAPLDFVVHGGDMIDASSIETIQEAARLYTLGVPVYLCLGNHDLTDPEAHRWWLQHAPSCFPGGELDFDVVCDDCVVHVAPTQWCLQPYCWQGEQRAHFLPAQRQRLEQALARYAERPHILVTHAPARGLPPEQTDGKAPSHATGPAFENELNGLLAHCRDPRLVLTGHSHMNMHVSEGATHYVSASSFVEAPFEFKLVEVSGTDVSVSTHALGDRVAFAWEYDSDHAYVQGRPCDRGF